MCAGRMQITCVSRRLASHAECYLQCSSVVLAVGAPRVQLRRRWVRAAARAVQAAIFEGSIAGMCCCKPVLHAHATALAICAHTSPACGPCARGNKNAPFHTWGYEGRPWTSNDCAQASHTKKNARAHDFSQKRCDAYDRSRPPVNAARTHFAPRDSCRPYIQHVRCASMTYNTV